MTDYKICPQCGDDCAVIDLHCDSGESTLDCRSCGHSDTVERIDTDGVVEWRHLVALGFGAMWHGHIDGGSWHANYLHSADEVIEAERWLRHEQAAGTIAPGAYLTRWDAEKQSVEYLVWPLIEPTLTNIEDM
jgi:hypothetical protein